MTSSISIHAPLAESDVDSERVRDGIQKFQPALPLRGATTRALPTASTIWHFNPRSTRRGNSAADFNPRSPCGERPRSISLPHTSHLLQSALPFRGATRVHGLADAGGHISIRAPLAGSDLRRCGPISRCDAISIRAPLAGSDQLAALPQVKADISIRAPLAGSDETNPDQHAVVLIFQSALPLRGAT